MTTVISLTGWLEEEYFDDSGYNYGLFLNNQDRELGLVLRSSIDEETEPTDKERGGMRRDDHVLLRSLESKKVRITIEVWA